MLVFIGIVSCASFPPEAPELSVELGNRISAIETSNIALLHKFFDQKRNEIDRFIEQEWVPTFAEEFFSDEYVADVWETIVSENNKQDRLRFIISTGPKLQEKINSKRLNLIKPLDDLERRIENILRAEYAQARAINNSITSFLISASKIAGNRNRYLGMVGITDEKMADFIDETDNAVSGLLKKTKDSQEKVDAAKEYIKKIKSIMENISSERRKNYAH